MPDEQDQSEVFDEDNFDPADAGAPTNEFRTFDELPDVLDVTSALGDGEEADDLELEEALSTEGVEPRADEMWGLDAPVVSELEGEEGDPNGPDEIELVYAGDLTEAKGAQASAAHWEAKSLSDDDIEDLGYGPEPTDAEQLR